MIAICLPGIRELGFKSGLLCELDRGIASPPTFSTFRR